MTTDKEDIDSLFDRYKKAEPEAEAHLIITKEREGAYYIFSNSGQRSPAWFISSTSVLNRIEHTRITWQPEAFVKFAATLVSSSDSQSADRAFEIILWALAQSGLNILDDNLVMAVFGGVIDQASLTNDNVRQVYEENLATKYGETRESVLARISPAYRPMAAVQLANEAAQIETARRQQAQQAAEVAAKRAETAEQELSKLKKFRQKLSRKEHERKQKDSKRRAKSKMKPKKK